MKFRSNRFILFLLTVFFFTGLVPAQQQDPIGLSDLPAPAWPADGKIPPELKETYVFIDHAKNEYVVAYPENLGKPDFAQNPGAVRIDRYELLRDVSPAITADVTTLNNARYKYAYTVSNGAASKQSIDQWILVLPAAAGGDTIRHPDGWMSIVQPGRKFKLKNPEWIRDGTAAIWSFRKVETVVTPGSSKSGFEIDSNLRPGFSVAYFRRSESIDAHVATQGNVPKPVKDQVDQLLALEYNSKTGLVIAPKFDKSVDHHTIAADFIQGIFTLSRAGVLDLNSEFVRAAMNELTGIRPGSSASGFNVPVPTRTPGEAEILKALQVSLASTGS